MRIVFDLDNTIVDEKGRKLRPGILLLMEKLTKENYDLILWTNSPRFRAMSILKDNCIIKYFSKIITKEDYDPEGKMDFKNINLINADVLIDDSPEQVKFGKKYNYDVILVKSFLSYREIKEEEMEEVYHKIQKLNYNIFKRIKRAFKK